jgi:WD40 repeat protein
VDWGAPVSRIFLSHSSINNAEAVALRDWLNGEGWDDIFLDTDPERGIAAGERWERALNQAASRCEAVLFLVSHAWLNSGWCLREFNLAHRLNKRLFGVLIEDLAVAELPVNLTSTWQLVQLATGRDHVMLRAILPVTGEEAHVTFSAEGLARLRGGLRRAGLDPRFFTWPPDHAPDRPPYRGLLPLETEDAGIFFGRDAPIVEALDRLRGLRAAAPPRLLVILGASGAGKSSFLRAGLLPRLQRDDRNFLPLPVLRPQRAAITGETGLLRVLENGLQAEGQARPRVAIRNAIQAGAPGIRPLLQDLADGAAAAQLAREPGEQPPILVLPIDQGEELFLGDGIKESEHLLALLRDLLASDAPGVLALITMRSDSYEWLQSAGALDGIPQATLSLPPMPRGAYQAVIEGPVARLRDARRALMIEPALTQALLADIESGGGRDALPLLAFTLERLFLEFGGSGRLTLADYETLGRIKGSIEAAVARALAAAGGDSRIPVDQAARLVLLRRGFIPWLAGIDPETGSPRRRVARLAEIPTEARPLIDLLTAQHLLATDVAQDTGEVTIEPAHEALLRQWGLLQGWLQEDFAALTTIEGVKRAARDWAANGRLEDWLDHAGTRLDDAEKVAARADLAGDLTSDARDYLRACRDREDRARREREDALAQEQTRLAEIGAAQKQITAEQARTASAQARTARSQRMAKWALAAVAVALAVGLGVGIWQRQQNLALERSLAASEIELKHGKAVLLGELARIQWLGGNIDATLRFAAHGTRIDLELGPQAVVDSAATALFAAVLSQSGWFLAMGGHPEWVMSAAFSPDGRRIITAEGRDILAAQPSVARVWDAATGHEVAVLHGHGHTVSSAAFSPDGTRIVTASWDKTVRIWDASTEREIAVLRGHEGWVWSAAFSPNGKRIVTASGDKTARVWDAATAREITVLAGHDNNVYSAVFSPDGRRIVTASEDASVRLWDSVTGTQLQVLRGHEKSVKSAAFSVDGTRIVSASADATARIWDAANGDVVSVLRAPDQLFSAVFSPDQTRIVAASSDKTVRVWDAATGSETAVLPGHEGWVQSARFSPDGTRIVSASTDTTARIWDVMPDKETLVLDGHDGLHAASFSPDGSRIVVASEDGTARIMDTATGKEIMILRGHEGFVKSATFSPDGKRIATGSGDETARIWDSSSGSAIAILRGHEGFVNSVAFSPDGTRVATASDDSTARLWDAATGKQLAVLRGHDESVTSAAFGPNGTRIVTASADRTARVWDVASVKQITVLEARDQPLSAAFAPDGTRIVTASADGTAQIWEVATGREIGILYRHEGSVNSATFSGDGERILTASDDGTVRIWDARTAKEIARRRGHEGQMRSAAFSPDRTRIVTASSDHMARIWDVRVATMSANELLVEACRRRLGGLTRLPRNEMRLAGYPDSAPEIDVCEGVR